MSTPEAKFFPNGLTVKELKELIKDWPETDKDGNASEVWIETEFGVSNVVKEVWPLNETDMLFECDVTKESKPK